MSQAAIAEMLAILTCRSPDAMAGGGGGKAKFTQHDVAALMHGLEVEEVEVIRVKHCGEKSHKLWAWWFMHLAYRGWGDKTGRLSALAELTLEEFLDSKKCRTCKGVEFVLVDEGRQRIVCPTCDGMGRHDYSARGIAKRMGFTSRLNHPWDERLIEARAKLIQVEYAGLEKMVANRSRK